MTLSALITFGSSWQAVISIAADIAKAYHHHQYTPAHLLRACLHRETGLVEKLHQMELDVYYLEEWADVRLEGMNKVSRLPDDPEPDNAAAAVLSEAVCVAEERELKTVNAMCLLIALCTPGIGFTDEQLKTFPFTREQLTGMDRTAKHLIDPVTGIGDMLTTVSKYLHRITDQLGLASGYPVVGRDGEIRSIMEVLIRKNRPNVLIIGEVGTGKTAVVNGLAKAIVNGQVPSPLQLSDIYLLNYSAFIAGATYSNELGDRLLQIMQQLKQMGRHILFIDDLHRLLGKSTNSGMANVLKAALESEEVILLATTIPEGFHKLIEPDITLRHRFETILLQEPDEALATHMIAAAAPVYERFYQLKILPESIQAAIRLSRRYLLERCLPDSAINLLDSTLSAIRAMQDTTMGLYTSLQEELLLLNEKEFLQVEELEWFYRQAIARMGALLLARLAALPLVIENGSIAAWQYCLLQLLEQLGAIAAERQVAVTPVDLSTMVATITGIPLGRVQSGERERLLNMEMQLRKRVVGQDHALKVVTDAILESRLGLGKAGQPVGSFFFLGPTGTGKTELAKSLADFLFQDERSMIRFDMSEFKEEHAIALLYGAPPGYVGYEAGGLLVNKIRQQPYAVVLFDEIEKAHPSVFDIFLQIMDEGKLHDRLGKTGDFSNALILFTSNIGSNMVAKAFQQGMVPAPQQLMELMSHHFRPEFLGRLTEIVPFSPIQPGNVEKIFDIHLQHLLYTLQQQQISLEVTSSAKRYLSQMGYSPQYGARPLREVIRGQLRRPLSRFLIEGVLQKNMKVTLDIQQEGLNWKISSG
ncbi:AAA family ATPase [Chitinophaga sp. 30R24]|uniref:AAA family ATPase n=1 Tax=Chitinophaga sp. 30R24 TaxID=3248838 RepID=UPI003B9149AB